MHLFRCHCNRTNPNAYLSRQVLSGPAGQSLSRLFRTECDAMGSLTKNWKTNAAAAAAPHAFPLPREVSRFLQAGTAEKAPAGRDACGFGKGASGRGEGRFHREERELRTSCVSSAERCACAAPRLSSLASMIFRGIFSHREAQSFRGFLAQHV